MFAGARALVVISGRAFVHKNVPPIRLIAYVNGVKAVDTVCLADHVQFEALVSSSIVSVDMYTDNPYSPFCAGISDDKRELSVALTRIAIYPRSNSV
ncbi:hypothetical protein D3C79_892560 [compost metagenome]